VRPRCQNRQQGSLTFTDLRLCAAIVDRLTFAGNIIETGTRLLPSRPRPRHPQRHRQPSPDTEGRQQMSSTRPPHGQPVTLAAAPRAALATELLQLCERSFTTASPTVIAELHTFLVAEGVHPATALGWLPTVSPSPPTIPSRMNNRPAAQGAGSACGVS
jgi:hypothetical protein